MSERVKHQINEILIAADLKAFTPAERIKRDLRFLSGFVGHEGVALVRRMRANRMTQADMAFVTAAFMVGEAVLSRLPRPGVTIRHR